MARIEWAQARRAGLRKFFVAVRVRGEEREVFLVEASKAAPLPILLKQASGGTK